MGTLEDLLKKADTYESLKVRWSRIVDLKNHLKAEYNINYSNCQCQAQNIIEKAKTIINQNK